MSYNESKFVGHYSCLVTQSKPAWLLAQPGLLIAASSVTTM